MAKQIPKNAIPAFRRIWENKAMSGDYQAVLKALEQKNREVEMHDIACKLLMKAAGHLDDDNLLSQIQKFIDWRI